MGGGGAELKRRVFEHPCHLPAESDGFFFSARYAQKYSDLPGAINWKRQWVRALEAGIW